MSDGCRGMIASIVGVNFAVIFDVIFGVFVAVSVLYLYDRSVVNVGENFGSIG